MKKNYLFLVAFYVSIFCHGQAVFINEIHYDNTGADTNEGIEIAGPSGTDLLGYEVRFYNGSDGGIYGTILNLSGIIPNQQNNMGTLWFPQAGIQNGDPDGLALVDNLGVVIQFLSYEGIITATEGPAISLTSEDIGVLESSSTPVNYSLQLIGIGSDYTDFSWNGPVAATPGLPNTAQTLPIIQNEIEGFALYPNPVTYGRLYLKSNNTITKQVEIYSMLGQRVYLNNVQTSEFMDITNLNRGIYMVRVEEEGKVATRKLVIK